MKEKVIATVLAIFMIVDAVLSVNAALHAPFPAAVPLGSPAAYLNVYLHVPIAWATYMLFIIGFILAIAYLATGNKKFDKYSELFIYTALVYAFLTLITGSMWAMESWGSAWNWDPRETAVLLLFIAYLVYVAIRYSIRDPERRATVSAVFAIAAFATVPISFLAPYLIHGSLHPTMSNTESFLSHPSTKTYFFSKVFTTVVTAILIPIAIGMRADKKIVTAGALGMFIILIIGALMVMPWGATGRVEAAYFTKGSLKFQFYTANNKIMTHTGGLIITVNGKNITLTTSKGLPKPNFIPVPNFARGTNKTGIVVECCGSKYWPTILGHIVKVSNGKVTVLKPFTVAWTLLTYGIFVPLFVVLMVRRRE
ncbi:cytochrome C assembly protein [Ignicoccus pacificus DSM 13166]|uniref:Cytochrome C assembly protein n=1 Tax=Ignicoccus pacificus DSM 13166 TaxID=940294 RepID=A0A977KAD7_9CREN|nr:cytochrome C assembly protein [Ignicoccus pacificus DSM 13166]